MHVRSSRDFFLKNKNHPIFQLISLQAGNRLRQLQHTAISGKLGRSTVVPGGHDGGVFNLKSIRSEEWSIGNCVSAIK